MQVLERDNKFIFVFSYNPRIVSAVKNIAGIRWNWDKKWWELQNINGNRQKAEQFAQRFGFSMAEQTVERSFDKPLPEMPDLGYSNDQLSTSLKLNLYPYQRQGVAYCIQKKRVLIGDQPGLGKAQPLTSKLATPEGWATMGNAYVGMPILGSNGEINEITAIFPQGKRPCYKVTFNDGHSVECDLDHIWSVRDVNRRRRGHGWTTKTTKDLLETGLRYVENEARQNTGRKPVLKWEIPIAKPFEIKDKKFLIHPYILGVLLGDGSMCGRSVCISIPDSEIETKYRVENLLPNNLKLRVNRHPACPQYYITQNSTTNKNPFKAEIERLGLNVKGLKKFIPESYMFSSYKQRLDLLRGLMDSDGSSKENRITFHSCSPTLANDIADLANSLGGQSIIRQYDRTKEGKNIEYQVNIRMNNCPFYMSRKVNQWAQSKRNYASRYIESIEYIGEKETQCIKVSASNSLYLTDHFIVTHNTAQAIAAVTIANQFPCIVICPSSLKENWKREFHMWTNKKAIILNDSNKNTFHLLAKGQSLFGQGEEGLAQVFITNYESLKKYFVSSIEKPSERTPLRLNHIKFSPKINIFKSIIIDESHRVKDIKTQQAKFTKGICQGKEFIFALTGTPVVNRPIDLVSQLGIIDQLAPFGGYKEFLKNYCAGDSKGHSNLKELNWMLNTYCFFRREKKDVLKDLPDKVRQIVQCEIINRREYNAALDDLESYLIKYKQATDEQVARSMKGEVMVRIGVLKNISARGKLNDVIEYISDIVESGEKIVVFIHLKEVAQYLKKMFPAAVSITGDDSTGERQKSIDSFQKNPDCQVIICSIKAAGVGLTLTASSRVAFVELPWHAADTEQCEDRVHRIGQKESVQCTYFLGKDTIDEWIYQIIDEKRAIADTVTGAKNDVDVSVMDGLINLFNKRKR